MSKREAIHLSINGKSDKSPVDFLGKVVKGDCLEWIKKLPNACIDCIYIDPPYFTQREMVSPSRQGGKGGRKIPNHELLLRYSDRWAGVEAKAGRSAYLSWLRERIEAMHRVLKPEGVFLLHLDWHVVHYAKVMCDEIFGDEAFCNELIWHYQTGGASKGHFSRKHDTILFYAKGPGYYFDGRSIAIPRTAKAMKRAKCPTGARIKVTDTHKNPEDVLVVPALNPMSNERTGYPTQKPVELLEKLITALCPPGGVVGDFFCGSGTTLVAAKGLRRHYMGCDVSADAVAIAKRRLAALEES